MKIRRTLGTLIAAGLIVPAGVLCAQTAPAQTSTMADSASSADTATTSARNTFSRIQDLAQSVRKEVGPLKFDTNGTSVTWKLHSTKLTRVRSQVNQIEQNVRKLSARKESLPAWQQQLLSNIKEDSHELVYQTSAAIKTLNAHHDTTVLATTRYPQYIDMISQKANDAAHSIGTVFTRRGVDMD